MSARQRLQLAVFILLGLLASGTIGYRVIEGWEWFDSLYFTVITLSTVGYREVHELSAAGRGFTVVLILSGFAGLGLAAQAIARLVIEGELRELVWRRRMEQVLKKIEGHVVVCGYGSVGRLVSEELRAAGWPIVVVEQDPERAQEAVEHGLVVVEGDATHDEHLEAAHVRDAVTAICALSGDAENVFATLSLRVLNPKLTIVSRYDEEETREKLVRAGADQTVSPKLMGAHRVVNCVLRPAATQLLDKAMRSRELDLRMDEFLVHEGSLLIGKPIHALGLREEHGLLIVAVRRADGTWVHAPGPNFALEGGETVVVIGRPDGVGALLKREDRLQRPD